MMTLDEAVKKVRPLDEKAMEGARKRWDSIAKPLHSLGELENMLTQIAGITGTPEVRVEKKAVVAMCADNGVVEEGVTQTGQEVTAVVAENFLEKCTPVTFLSSPDTFSIAAQVPSEEPSSTRTSS